MKLPKSTRKTKGSHTPADQKYPFICPALRVSLAILVSNLNTNIEIEEYMLDELSLIVTSSLDEKEEPKNTCFVIA